MKRLTLLGLVLIALAVAAGGTITGCDSKKGNLDTNLLPGVELTATAPESETVRYDIEFHWTGWDADGEVDYFEYLIDPPNDVIAHPGDFVDTLTWEVTDAYSGRFTFFAPAYDSSTMDEPHKDYRDQQIALGTHVFVIRAVDDMGARSIVNADSWVAFTAATLCPRTTITSPPPGAGEGTYVQPQEAGLRVTFRWDGDDPDGIFSDKPIYYMYKLLDVTYLPKPGGWVDVDDLVLEDAAPWDTLDPGVTKLTVDLDDGHQFAFAVRAVDEAHAVEPLLVINRNLLWLVASKPSSSPALEVRSTAFGNRKWTGWFFDIEEYEVPLGSFFEFTLAGNADWYGGLITGYSYGWKLPDVENNDTNPTGNKAWTPWSTSTTKILARFSKDFTTNPETGQVEDVFLYVRCKDDGGAVTLATIKFNVVVLDPIYKLGVIDDWRVYPKTTFPGEITHDMFWQKMLRGYDYGEGWGNVLWDEWDAPHGEEMPTLTFLSQFENLVWTLNDRREYNPNAKSAFYVMNDVDNMNTLAVYISSESKAGTKGKLWLYGNGMTESTILPYGPTGCGYPYAVDELAQVISCSIRPRNFAYEFLHITGQFVRADDQPPGARVNMFENSKDRVSYISFDEQRPAIADTAYKYDPIVNPAPYRNLPRKLNPDLGKWRAGTMLNFEVLEHPKPEAPSQLLYFREAFGDVPGELTGLVPLYKFRARGSNSKADKRYCAFRFIPGPGDHGEIVYFFFPMYFLDDTDARRTAKAVLTDMFGLPDPGD